MRAIRTFVLLLPFSLLACHDDSAGSGGAASATAIATASASAPQPQASVATAPSASSAAAAAPTFGRRAGLAGMMLRSSMDVSGLTDAQKDTITKLGTSLDSDSDGTRDAFKTFHGDLVAGVKAGKVDTAKMQGDEAAIDKVIAAAQAKQADALDGLHAALNGDQRKALTAAVRAKQAAREERMPPAPPAGDAGTAAADWQKRKVDRMTRELALDDGQQKQVTALVAKNAPASPVTWQARRDEMKKKSEAILTAFEQDAFDGKKQDLSMGPPGAKPHDMFDKHIALVSGLLPILKQDQRDKLAASMDRPHGPEGAPGRPGHTEGDVDPAAEDFDFP